LVADLDISHWERAYAIEDAAGWVAARDIVDVARVVLVPANQAYGHFVVDREVDVALDRSAEPTVGDAVSFHLIGCGKTAWIRLVGDDAKRAGFRARAVQRALGTGQRFD